MTSVKANLEGSTDILPGSLTQQTLQSSATMGNWEKKKKNKKVHRGHHPWHVYINRKAVFFSRAIDLRSVRKGPIHYTSCCMSRTAHMHWVLTHQHLYKDEAQLCYVIPN